jgi:hypothetical protein
MQTRNAPQLRYPTASEYSRAWQNYRLCEHLLDGAVHPKNLVNVFEELPVLQYTAVAIILH